MSWFKDFLGLKKVKVPKVKPPEELASMDEFESDAYLKGLMRKSGFEKQIKTGGKKPATRTAGKPKLAAPSYLGAI